MIIISGHDAVVRSWMADRLGCPLSEGHAFGVYDETTQTFTGGVSFTNFTGPGIEMTIAGRGCFSRQFWQFLGEFVFGRMGCVRLVVTTRRPKTKRGNPVAKMAKRFGFQFEGVARRFYGDCDGMQWSLLKDEAILRGYYKEGIADGRA